ncbi:hypothetical protein O0L34_g7330 [Tuta absoluta]|nr:hypothetical protein O0L34_g7330 [Tuta absoluta]
MKRNKSLKNINGSELVSNARDDTFIQNSEDKTVYLLPPRKRHRRSTFSSILDHYSITIKPKLHRSNSLSELATITSDYTLDFIKHTSKILIAKSDRVSWYESVASSGDASLVTQLRFENEKREIFTEEYSSSSLSWNSREKKEKKDMNQYNNDCRLNFNRGCERQQSDPNITSSLENSSLCSTDETQSAQKIATFPFKPTPSGNLKVQSNQVVFQSSTVGVLLADPTQAKVKVKFEGKSGGDPGTEEHNFSFGQHIQMRSERTKTKSPIAKEHKGKDLNSLGYAMSDPIDWLRVQLPKKQDLFQEFYRRIHNYTNTDTIIHIGDEEFHCHRIVLQIYSSFFDKNPHREVELPLNQVTPDAFQTIYEWMIFSGPDSNKGLKRDNVLELFCASQYLSIKDLEEQCWSFIVNEHLFTEDTAFALFRQARAKGMTPVMDLMIPRVMKFFLPLVASTDFLDLEADEILILLKSNYICVTSEIEVLMAGVRWLYGDWQARRCHAVDVMRCVRFGLISPWQLVDIKRNPDNAEILEIVNETEVQQMVDDGLAYVIIKYWYGNNSKNYYHWLDVLGLSEPAERNWIGEETNHVTYKDFLKYLEQFMVPKEQMFQQMAIMQPPRRNDDGPGGVLRGMDEKDMRRPKMDFPLPATLKGLAEKEKFSTMSEFFENRQPEGGMTSRSQPEENGRPHMQQMMQDRRRTEETRQKQEEVRCNRLEHAKQQLHEMQMQRRKEATKACVHNVHVCSVQHQRPLHQSVQESSRMYEPPEKDSSEDTVNTTTDTSSNGETSTGKHNRGKRHSIAASYLAAATASLGGPRRVSQPQHSPTRTFVNNNASRAEAPPRPAGPPGARRESPQISLFNQSKESLARINMNKLSTSILGPANKNYIAEGSLFNWDRETVLVFGGIDPHTTYGMGKNNGKDIFRFDPVTNTWDYVGELPEPRHHHSIAFLRGRVYLVGGADPRDDDIRGKSVVVSTVWSYEPVSRSWYSESGLTIPRKSFGLVVHRMALYAIGGQDKRGRHVFLFISIA